MMDTAPKVTLRAIAWREFCPWLAIFRTLSLALSPPLVFLATCAVLLQPIGWRVAGFMLLGEDEVDIALTAPVRAAQELWPGQRGVLRDSATESFSLASLASSVILETYHELTASWQRLFDARLSLTQFAYLLAGSLWNLLLWALVGGAITRVAVVSLGREERISVKDAVLFAGRRYGSYFLAPLYPLLGVVLLTLPLWLLGLVMWLDLGVVIAGVLWILVLLCTFAMAVLLVGALFGWPLMWPTISAENGDPFEALSRSFGYVLQRPLQYLGFVVVAALFGLFGWFVVALFGNLMIELAWWGVSWGAGRARLAEIQLALSTDDSSEMGYMLYAGTGMIRAVNQLPSCIASGFAYCFFFCNASVIYLLLRQVDDETEFDEVYMEEDDQRFTLPAVQPDTAGVPQLQTEASVKPESDPAGIASDETLTAPPTPSSSEREDDPPLSEQE